MQLLRPADHHQLGAVDHGYPRSYGTQALADPHGDILTAHPGCPTTPRTRLKNRRLRVFV